MTPVNISLDTLPRGRVTVGREEEREEVCFCGPLYCIYKGNDGDTIKIIIKIDIIDIILFIDML